MCRIVVIVIYFSLLVMIWLYLTNIFIVATVGLITCTAFLSMSSTGSSVTCSIVANSCIF